MKKLFLIFFTLLLTSLIVQQSLNAQPLAPGEGNPPQEAIAVFPLYRLPENDNAGGLHNKVITKATRNFSRTFSKAEHLQWYETGNELMAYFTVGDVKTRASYNAKGKWISTLRTYNEALLPTTIRALVKSSYYDYTIVIVNEFTKEQRTVYIVNIEDKKGSKILRVCDDEEMQVIQEVTKIQ